MNQQSSVATTSTDTEETFTLAPGQRQLITLACLRASTAGSAILEVRYAVKCTVGIDTTQLEGMSVEKLSQCIKSLINKYPNAIAQIVHLSTSA